MAFIRGSGVAFIRGSGVAFMKRFKSVLYVGDDIMFNFRLKIMY